MFIPYQSTLCDYWREVGTPFMNRDYARFCLYLPRVVLDDQRLLGDVFRRYYGKLAVIPGTYANNPLILTGRYLMKRRGTQILPEPLQIGPFAGFKLARLRMDMASIRSSGKGALWPLFEAKTDLNEWLDVGQLKAAYQAILLSLDDIRPLRKLQAVQTFAYCLSQTSRGD